MAVLGTSVSDPNFYANKAARTGEALSLVLARLEQKREERKAEEMREIERFFRAAEVAPEVASTWGETIKQKYGGKHPGVSEMVDVLQRRWDVASAVKQRQDQAKDAWLTNWQNLNADFAQQGQAVAAMPDQAPAPAPGAGGGYGAFPAMAPAPNVAKQGAAADLRKVDPRYFSRKALEQLPPQLQVAAADYLKNGTSFEPPEPMTIFDPFKHLPAEQQALEAGLNGQTRPEQLQAARIKLGLEQSPSRKAFEKFSLEDREDRQTFEAKESEADRTWRDKDREARDKQMRSRMTLQDSLSRAREARRVANERGLIDYRSTKSGGGSLVSWESLVEDARTAQKDYDERQKQALDGLESGEKARAKTLFLKSNGSRPRALTETEARRLARRLNADIQEGALSIDAAEDEALEMVADIMSGDSFDAAQGASRERRRVTAVVEDRETARQFISEQHPDWTPDQIETAVNDYLWAKAEGR